jgi:cytochrome c oxidase subunit 2
MRSKSLLTLLIYFIVIAAVTMGLMVLPPWLPDLVSEEGKSIDNLFWAMVIMSVVILSIVSAIVIYALVHFRVRPTDMGDGEPMHGNHSLELVWTIIPTIIVVVIGWFSYVVLNDNEDKADAGTPVLNVNVNAYQFGWSFDYPKQGIEAAPELVLPKGTLVKFHIESKKDDVIHSFWVPEARIKQDAVPGIATKTQWTPSKLGKWQVVCAELCGTNHNAMRADVRIVKQDEFDAWLDDQKSGGDTA